MIGEVRKKCVRFGGEVCPKDPAEGAAAGSAQAEEHRPTGLCMDSKEQDRFDTSDDDDKSDGTSSSDEEDAVIEQD